MARFKQTFNFCYKKGNSAETGFEFVLYNQTDICPLPAAQSWKKKTLIQDTAACRYGNITYFKVTDL